MQLWTKTWDYRDEIQTHENICVWTYKWIFTSWMFSFDVYIWFPIVETSKHYRRNLFDIYFNENSAAKGGGGGGGEETSKLGAFWYKPKWCQRNDLKAKQISSNMVPKALNIGRLSSLNWTTILAWTEKWCWKQNWQWSIKKRKYPAGSMKSFNMIWTDISRMHFALLSWLSIIL